MQQTASTQQLERVFYHPVDNHAEVYLRDNIRQETWEITEFGDENAQEVTEWVADEVFFTTTLSKEEVEANFDTLWVEAETKAKPLEERVAELEELLGIVIDQQLGVTNG